MSQTDDRQTTDGRLIAYSDREREFTFAKNHNTVDANVGLFHTCHLILVHETLTKGYTMPYTACMSVCVFFCLSTCISQKPKAACPNFTKLAAHVTCGRGVTVAVARSCSDDSAIR